MVKARTVPRMCSALLLIVAVCVLPIAASGASGSLTTSFNGNVTFQGNMFDVTVQPGIDIVITAFDINILMAAQPVPIRVYYREGGYQGYETNAGAWTLLLDVNVTSQGTNTPTPLPLNSGLALSAGKTYGFYITVNGSHDISEMVYMLSASVYSDAHISISTAASLSWPLFTDPHSPRTWSGTIYYAYTETPPQTGDEAGNALWLYILVAVLSGGTIVILIDRWHAARHRA